MAAIFFQSGYVAALRLHSNAIPQIDLTKQQEDLSVPCSSTMKPPSFTKNVDINKQLNCGAAELDEDDANTCENQGSTNMLINSWKINLGALETAQLKNASRKAQATVYVPDAPFLKNHRKDALHMPDAAEHTQFLADVAIHEALLASPNRVQDMEKADFVFVPFYSRLLFFCGMSRKAEAGAFARKIIQKAGAKKMIFIFSSTRKVVDVASEIGGMKFIKQKNVHVGMIDASDHRGGRCPANFDKDFSIPYFIPNALVSAALTSTTGPAQKKYLLHFRGHPSGSDFRSTVAQAFQKVAPKDAQQTPFKNEQTVDVKVSKKHNTVPEEHKLMRDSVFCLVPSGITPTSRRLYESIVNECIPVIVSPKFKVPWDTINDPKEFSVMWDGAEHESLEALAKRVYSMSAEEINAKFRRLKEVRNSFVFELPGLMDGPGATDSMLALLESQHA